MDKLTYVPKRCLPWLPILSSNETKVFLNLASWTDKDDYNGEVYMDTLASGRKGTDEKGCNMTLRGVQKILRRLKARGVINLHSGKGRRYPNDQEGKRGIKYMMQDATAQKLAAGGPAPLGRGAAAPLKNSNSPLNGECTLWHSVVQSEARGVQSQDPASAVDWHSMTDAEEFLDWPDPGPGCVAIPHALVRSDISGNALKLYCILKSYGTKGKLNWSALSHKTGIGRNNVETAANELALMQWIKIDGKTYEIPAAVAQEAKEYAAAARRAKDEAEKRAAIKKPSAPVPAPSDPALDSLLAEITDRPVSVLPCDTPPVGGAPIPVQPQKSTAPPLRGTVPTSKPSFIRSRTDK